MLGWKKIKRALFPPDGYALIRTKPNRSEIERFDTPISLVEIQAQRDLEPGRYVLHEIRNGRYDTNVWTEEVGDPRKAREIDDLRSELREIRSAVSNSTSRAKPADFRSQLKRSTFEAVLNGNLSVRDAKAIADLAAAFDGSGDKKGLSETVDDPKDVGEIAGRSVLEVMENPESLEEFSRSAGKAAGGFLDGALEPEGNGAVVEDEPDEVAEEDGQTTLSGGIDGGPASMGELGESSTLRERYDEAVEDLDEELDEEEPDAAPIEPEAEADQEAAADGGEEEPEPEVVADEL